MVLVAGGTILFMPVTGTVAAHEADHMADVLVRLARIDERVRAALLAVLRYGAVLELLTIVGSLGLAVNVDLYLRSKGKQGVPPDNPAVSLLIGREVQEVVGAINAAGGGGEGPAPAPGPPSPGWAPPGPPG